MTLATLVNDYEKTLWNIANAGPDTTVTPTFATGDLCIVIAGAAEWGNSTDEIQSPTITNVSFTPGPKGVPTVGGANSEVFSWYGVASGASPGTPMSIQTAGGSPSWGFDFVRFSGSDGIGATASNVSAGANTATSLTLTTNFANSGILAFFADWVAPSLTGHVWKAINGFTPATNLAGGEVVAYRETSHATYYCAYWPDAGAAGAKITGLNTPATARWSGLALEVRGSGGAPPVFKGSQAFPFFME